MSRVIEAILDQNVTDAAAQPVGRSRWISDGFWAICDQSLFAGTNFLVNVVLARTLIPADYGAFTVAFTVFLFLGTFHTALLTEPMLVFGSGRNKSRLPEYLTALLYGHVGVVMIAGVLLAIAGLLCRAMHAEILGVALLALAATQPFILFQWLMRRACYIRSQTRLAACAGAGYMVVVLLGLSLIFKTGRLTSVTALAVMGGGSALAGIWLVYRLVGGRPKAIASPVLRQTARDHWGYGRWAMATALVSYIPTNVYYLVLPLCTSLAASGALKAIVNLIMPFLQVNAVLCTLLLPRLVQVRGTAAMGRQIRGALLLLAGAPAMGWILLGLTRSHVVHLVYGTRFEQYGGYLWLIGVLPALAGLSGVLGTVLRAHERPDLEFAASCWTWVASIVGVGLMIKFGILGASIGMVLSSLVRSAMFFRLSKRLLSRDVAAQ